MHRINVDASFFNGQMTFGERPAKLCKNTWTSMVEVKNKYNGDEQWTFSVDKLVLFMGFFKKDSGKLYKLLCVFMQFFNFTCF